MTRTENVKVRLADGTLRDLKVEVSMWEPWTLEYQGSDGASRIIRELDLFEALKQMRKELAQSGCQILCAGARPDVAPSGMSRSMSGGRKVYILHLGKPAGGEGERLDIFDYADATAVGTVEQQRAHFEAWIESLPQKQ